MKIVLASLIAELRTPPMRHENPYRSIANGADQSDWPPTFVHSIYRRASGSKKLGQSQWEFEIFVNPSWIKSVVQAEIASSDPRFEDICLRATREITEHAKHLYDQAILRLDATPEDFEEFTS